MKNTKYPLPQKALDILEELGELELYSSNFYIYLSLCCNNAGYFNAAKKFANEAPEEVKHFQTIAKIALERGCEIDVPKVDKPEIDFTDLKSGIMALSELMVKVTKAYNESVRSMMDIDMLAWNELLPFLSIQQKALGEVNDMMSVFGELKDKESQLEQDALYFGETLEVN